VTVREFGHPSAARDVIKSSLRFVVLGEWGRSSAFSGQLADRLL